MKKAQPEVGKSYRIYGKMDGMELMRPIGKDGFVANLIYASIYRVNSSEDVVKLQREVDFLNKNNDGIFELRKVPGYSVGA